MSHGWKKQTGRAFSLLIPIFVMLRRVLILKSFLLMRLKCDLIVTSSLSPFSQLMVVMVVVVVVMSRGNGLITASGSPHSDPS